MKRTILKRVFSILLIGLVGISLHAQHKPEPIDIDELRSRAIQRIIFRIFPNKLQSRFKKLAKSNNQNNVQAARLFLAELRSQEKEEEYIKKFPYTYFLLKVVVANAFEASNTFSEAEIADNLLSRSVLIQLSEEDLTQADIEALKWLKRLAQIKRFLSGSSIPADTVRRAAISYVQFIQNEKQKISDTIAVKNEKIIDIQRKIKSLNNRVDDLDVERIQKVSVVDMRLDQADQIRKELEMAKKSLSSSDLSLSGNSKIQIDTKRGIVDNFLEASPERYEIGRHCDGEIQEIAYQLIELFLIKVTELKRDEKDSLVIDLQLIGHADGHGYQKLLNIKSSMSIDGVRYVVDGQYKDCNIERNNRITNEQLAFLRAYCAYGIFQDWLLQNGIDLQNSKHRIDFAVEEHPEKGPEYRKIEIKLSVDKLYLHHEEEIGELKAEIRRLETRKEILEAEIDELEKKKERLEKLLAQSGPDGVKTKRILEMIRAT
ncbi:MAG: hypothetical protein AAF587_09215 [Bacteroidota bacterium]